MPPDNAIQVICIFAREISFAALYGAHCGTTLVAKLQRGIGDHQTLSKHGVCIEAKQTTRISRLQ